MKIWDSGGDPIEAWKSGAIGFGDVMDVTMGVVGFLGPVGFIASTSYFIGKEAYNYAYPSPRSFLTSDLCVFGL